ncbi:hypothetical protein GF373_12445, partial [bacterium]|nr:hypothetical protein [bacterium]
MKDPNVKDRTGEAAQSLRDRARDRSKKNSLQKAAEEFKDDIDSRLQLF